ncbi:MAG: hypothetical protein ABW223_05465 [Rariglobus sp.]
MEFADGTLHEAGEIFERAADGDLGFDGFEFALELLDLAEAGGDDLGVLLIELLEALELGFVVGQVGVERGEFFGVMNTVGLVVGGGGGLEITLGFLALALLAFDLVFEESDLAGELSVGVVGLVGLGLGVADAAFDDGLVDGIGLGGFLSGEAEPDEDAFEGAEESHGDVC